MTPSFQQSCSNDVDDRTVVLRTMRSLENSVYKRPRAHCMPEIFRGLWRRQIVEWMYVLIKYCKLKHEATAAAIYYLDTAVTCESNPLVKTPRDYQLCAITTVHLALKVYDSPAMRVVKLSCLVKLGNGEFTEDDIIQKEQDLLRALAWRVNPPTADCFLHRYMELLPFLDDDDDDVNDNDDGDDCENYSDSSYESDASSRTTDDEYDVQLGPILRRRRQRLRKLEAVAYEFIELAMARDRFLSVPPSIIAYAAMLSAMELTSNHKQHQQCYYDWSAFLRNMTDVAEMGDDFADVIGASLECSQIKPTCVSRMVCRTKLLMDRIVNGLDLPPEEEDDAFYNTELGLISRCLENTRDGDNKNTKKASSFGYLAEFAKSFASKRSSPPSPTSTVSTVSSSKTESRQ
mmetsp:Transcript_21966/g.52287  ORF Transcript_21966/g.52287 Transcript_21966/m.52287 type:complete len:404 (+) Transcript_21966:141-1352(+)|eukprot:CAMPEP_0197180318 /NCGR_PEP_ID=MMETSP1423-20130617/4962_1 /TAXON_ID=476441 /ORGANISM="Pseudo-nitzschia heimii, Strain UNC1101" /LENGTH=403 /DNA_ID=CAMNT_0042630377 /DNA_START=122 /DNA_END=1333 /DNA_ORIENTATION=-